MTPPTTDGVSPLHQIVGEYIKKTKNNKGKPRRQVIPPKSRNWIRRATPALFAPVSRCVRFCREQREQTPVRAVRAPRAPMSPAYRPPPADATTATINNSRQARRPVRSLLPAVRAVAGVFGAFQSGVKIEGVISLLRSSSPRAYSRKKKVGVILRKRCYCEQKGHLSLYRTPERKMSFFRRTHSKIASQNKE